MIPKPTVHFFPASPSNKFGWVLAVPSLYGFNESWTLEQIKANLWRIAGKLGHFHLHGIGECGPGSLESLRTLFYFVGYGYNLNQPYNLAISPEQYGHCLLFVQTTKASSYAQGEISFIIDKALELGLHPRLGTSHHSLGGFGYQNWLATSPANARYIAASTVVSTGKVEVATSQKAAKTILDNKIALWLMHGNKDTVVNMSASKQLYDAVKTLNPNYAANQFSIMKDKGHAIFTLAGAAYGKGLNLPDNNGKLWASWLSCWPEVAEGFNNPGISMYYWQLLNAFSGTPMPVPVFPHTPQQPPAPTPNKPPVEAPDPDKERIKELEAEVLALTSERDDLVVERNLLVAERDNLKNVIIEKDLTIKTQNEVIEGFKGAIEQAKPHMLALIEIAKPYL